MNYDVDTGKNLARKKGDDHETGVEVGELANFVEYVVYRVKIARKQSNIIGEIRYFVYYE